MKRRGRKSAAQTPAPQKERVYGSAKNPVGSAASKTSASKIQLSDAIVKTLEDKRNDFNDKHPTKKVSLATLKAVMRRGMGAYSKSHRPTITGGAPNSRQAWGFARVNKFLKKYAGQQVKAAYVQDDDLLEKGGKLSTPFRFDKYTELQKILYNNTWSADLVFIFKYRDISTAVIYNGGSVRYDDRNDEKKKLAWFYKNIDDDFPFVEKVLTENFGAEVAKRVKDDIKNKKLVKFDVEKEAELESYENLILLNHFTVMFIRKGGVKVKKQNNLAPNGKPSNLTDEQYKLVRTPEFKAWFGDWENDPENASKVVDENGEPLVVYRGDSSTNKKGFIFKTGFNRLKYVDKNRLPNQYFFYFVDKYHVANGYAENGIEDHNSDIVISKKKGSLWYPKVYEYFLNIRKPLDLTPKNPKFPTYKEFEKSLKRVYKNQDDLDTRVRNPKEYGYSLFFKEFNQLLNDTLGDYPQIGSVSSYDKDAAQYLKRIIERKQNDTFLSPIWAYFAEYENDYDKSRLLLAIVNTMEEKGYDGLEFLEDTNYLDIRWDDFDKTKEKYKVERWNKKPIVFAAMKSQQVKLADGSNVTFDSNNPDIRYNDGGMTKINLPDTESSYESLQTVLAAQGYELKRVMKPTKSVEQIAEEHDATVDFIEQQLEIGTEHEMEHTYSTEVARQTALHHLAEDPEYYINLKDMEMRTEAEKLEGYYKMGGALKGETTCEVLDENGERQIDEVSIKNMTECLNDLPQTKSMHFDYETNDYTPERKKLHRDIIYEFKKDLICVEREKPIAILMGGSPASGKSTFLKKYAPYLLKEEIFKVDADEIRSKLPEYRGYNATQTHLETKDIVNTLLSDRNIGIPCRFDVIYDGTMNNTKSYLPLINLLKNEGYKVFIVYIDKVPKDVIVKRALERYKKSGRFVPLEVIDDFFEKGTAAMEQLKAQVDGYMIIDGSNTDYKIIERGGEELPQDRNYSKIGQPIKITTEDVVRELKDGGEIDADDPKIKEAMTHKAGAAGGLLVGNRHSEGGIKAINKSTGQPLEMEGGEVVITRDAVSDDTKREFEGEMLTNREILSRINESGGGVSFADGGDIPERCACKGKEYKFGGKMMKDNEIVENIMTSYRKLFGVQYPELKTSEAMNKIFAHRLKFEAGGQIYGEGGTLTFVNRKLPTFNAFQKLNKDSILPQGMKRAYKEYLNKKYFVKFEELPHVLQAALLMGNQKLVDSYINS